MSMPTEADLKSSSSSGFHMPILKWERRKRPSTAYAPSLRSGSTMALWQNKNTGIMFGGVTDEDTSEETLESVFHNDLYVSQLALISARSAHSAPGTAIRLRAMVVGCRWC